jgi:hypothetical protein
MFIKVRYFDRTYGTGKSAKKYTLMISRGEWGNPNDLSVSFDFESATGGQSQTWDDDSTVVGGEICLPKRQALALATAILSYYRQSENQSELSPIKIHLDEEDIISRIIPKITVQELSRMLQVEEKEIVKLASSYPWLNPVSANTNLSLDIVKKINEQLEKSESGNDA